MSLKKGSKSYVDVVNGVQPKSTMYMVNKQKKFDLINLDSITPKSYSWLVGCIVGEAKDVYILSIFFGIFSSFGLVDDSINIYGD